MFSALKSVIIPTSQRRQVDANYGKLSAQGTDAGDTCPANLSSLSLTCWYFQLESGTSKNNVMIKYMYQELFTSLLNKHYAPNDERKQQLVFRWLPPFPIFIQCQTIPWSEGWCCPHLGQVFPSHLTLGETPSLIHSKMGLTNS